MNAKPITLLFLLFLLISNTVYVLSIPFLHAPYVTPAGPRVFPIIISALLYVALFSLIANAIRKPVELHEVTRLNIPGLVVLISSTILYIALFTPLGYIIATFLYAIVLLKAYEPGRRIISIIMHAFLITAFVFIVFQYFFNAHLPYLPFFMES